jgi:hypothetical protein
MFSFIFTLPFYILVIIASAFFLWGGITLLRAKKDPLNVARGNKILLWTVSGFLIILFAFFVVNLISNFLQGGGVFQQTVIETPDEFPPAPAQEEFPSPPQ